MKRRRFLLCILGFLCTVFLASLGYWQLKRAEEKITMLNKAKLMQSMPPEIWSPEKDLPLQYQPVSVSGRYLSHIFLLDNSYFKHQFGYQVISVLELQNEKVILVDRGWVPGDVTRQQFPYYRQSQIERQIEGKVYYPSSKAWTLGDIFEKKGENLTVLEAIEPKLISQFLHKSVYPFIIRLNPGSPDGFMRQWPVVSMPPERHKAYALQWFLMALVMLVMTIVLGVKKSDEKNKN